MKIHIETERLLMRDLLDKDVDGMFELDSDVDVHAYLGKEPIKTLEEAKKTIDYIRLQYAQNGIGRWAVIDKYNGAFLGWSGFKYITDTINGKTLYYDLGYRFIKRYWGKGYATETALASLQYGFKQLGQEQIYGMADIEHEASNSILQKIGMCKVNEFTFDGILHNFYNISRLDWENRPNAILETRNK